MAESEQIFGSANGHDGEFREKPVIHRYRYGYQIDGENPVLVEHSSDLGTARREARAAAHAARERIREAGISKAGVSWWTQCRTTRTEVEFAAPEVEAL